MTKLTLYQADCLQALKELEEGSIDSIITDPPYALTSTTKPRIDQSGDKEVPFIRQQSRAGGFMGMAWDSEIPSVEIWQECLRVLKNGAFAFIFMTPRQDSHLELLLNLRQAGFNISFTPIVWAYACLSQDTEVLTKEGWISWERLYKTNIYNNFEILIYNEENDSYVWEQPSAWNYYRIGETGYHINSLYTDQFVSANHRVYTRKGIIQAKDLQEQEDIAYLPEVPEGILDMESMAQERQERRNILLNIMQAESKYPQASFSKWQTYPFYVRGTETETTRSYAWRKEQSLERRDYLLQDTWELQRSKVYQMPKRVYQHGEERRLCNGTQDYHGTEDWQTINQNRGSASYRPQSNQQQVREPSAIQEQSGTQEVRRKSYLFTKAKISKEYYEGIVFCPTVSTGLFIARRNGKIFITGNSGFPKAMNISKMVDKRLGFERKVIGEKIAPDGIPYSKRMKEGHGPSFNDTAYGDYGNNPMNTTSTSEQAKSLDGSYGGFQPKPAVEMIVVAMKPLSEKTYIDQALKNQHGITWLDDARIPYNNNDENLARINKTDKGIFGFGNNNNTAEQLKEQGIEYKGRFPANLLVSGNVLDTGEISKAGGNIKNRPTKFMVNGKEIGNRIFESYDDSGDFSRYFSLDAWAEQNLTQFVIEPKADKGEREENLELMTKERALVTNFQAESVPYRMENGIATNPKAITNRTNIHPSVKPIDIMSYLIKLSTREGDTVLDPFLGSGTTMIAARNLRRNCIGMEREEQYIKIAKGRLQWNAMQKMGNIECVSY